MSTARTVSIALVLIALAALGAWWLRSAPESSPRPTDSEVSGSVVPDSAGPKAKPRTESIESDVPAKAEPPSREPAESPKLPASPRVRILDAQGAAIENLSLRWTLKRGSTVGSGEGWTNADGEMALPGSEPCQVRVWSDDDDWSLPGEEVTSTAEHPAVIQATRNMTLTLLVVLADGTPFAGEATLIREAGTQAAWRREVLFDGISATRVRGVPPEGDLSLRVRKAALGYDAQTHAIARADISEGRTLVITLKKGTIREEGFLEVDFSNLGWLVTRIQFAPPGKLMAGSDLPVKVSQTLWRSKPWPVGHYIVRIYGRGYWESGLVEIRPNETTTVIADSYLPASVSVTVMDEDGKPLKNAVLTRSIDEYVSFNHMVPLAIPGMRATSNVSGIARLDGLRYGRIALKIEADGYEPHLLDIEIAEGESGHIAGVYLKRATGRILVELAGMRAGQDYTILVLQPAGVPVREARIARQVTEFTLLPCRAYIIAALPKEGGKGVSKLVAPSHETPELKIELDVSGLEPRDSGKQR